MKIAITGANGFLGSHLVKRCISSNMEVIALVRSGAKWETPPANNKLLSIRSIDYNNNLVEQLSELKKEIGSIDYFLHNAGLTVSLQKEEYFKVNTVLTQTLLSSLRESKLLSDVGKFVQISSYAAHGPKGIDKPVSHYGESKKQAEQHVIDSGFNYLIFRPTAVYGAGDYAFLPLFKAASNGLYPLTNPAQKMSMIHGEDLANMIVSSLHQSNQIIHANDGKTYLHQDFINALETVLNRKVRKIPIPAFISKISLGISDIWNDVMKKRPGLTLEKFEEISQDWNLHETSLPHCNTPPKFSLVTGFEDAYQFYKNNNLL